ncbi:peptide-binding protein [uncultured Mailhella sp.]|uniref:peptide-binding protein n=1 Tax=uncultured Mailhella sp. TaxID=1981031 RepID=UPI0025D9264D|nr:peptide-binding protein [uncultured Mailhella sp.]
MRPRSLRFVVVFLFCLVLAAGAARAGDGNVSSAQPETGGHLIMGSIGEPSNLIPYLASDSASAEVAGLLYTSPLEYDKDFNIVKCAAEEWEVLEGGLFMRFRLKEGLVWQDGHPLTADDVTFTYKLMTDPKTPTAYAADFLNVKEYRQTGPLSFEVRYDAPYARAAITWMHPILPRHILEHENIASTRYARNPVGAGPFKLKSWEPGSRIVLEANDRYFKGRPYLDEIIYRIIPDSTTMFLEARAGKLDFTGLSPQQYLRQTSGEWWDKNWRKYKYLAFGYTYLGLNQKSPFFKDKKGRQALSFAIDREGIIKGALLGMGEPAFGPYKPGTWVYNTALKAYDYDPERARRLLAEAGWTPGKDGILEKDGLPFEFTILVNQGNNERIKVAVILQQMFRAVGVKVAIRTVEWAAFLKEFVDTRKFDALILAWNILDDPDIYDVWHSSAIAGNGLNFVGFSNEEVDRLLEKGRTSADRQVRKAVYDRFQEILHEEQPYLFLYVPYSLPMVQARFQGIQPAPAGITYNLDRWWVPRALQQ